MKQHAVTLLILIFVLAVNIVGGRPSVAQDQPALPFIQRGVCPFECCQFGRWRTHATLHVYETEGDTSRILFNLAVGDTFRALTGNVHMDRVGVVIVTKRVNSYMPGDTVYTLSYRGEGLIDVWHQGKVQQVDIFWSGDDEADSSNVDVHDPRWKDFSGVLLTKPIMIWWVNVLLPNGQTGRLRLVNTTISGFGIDERIEGMSGC